MFFICISSKFPSLEFWIAFLEIFGVVRIIFHVCCSGVERGFKDKPNPRLVKMVLSATLTQDPNKLAQLDLHHPLFLTTGETRYKLPERLESYKLVWHHNCTDWANFFLSSMFCFLLWCWKSGLNFTVKKHVFKGFKFVE